MKLSNISKIINAEFSGNGEFEVVGISSVEKPKRNMITFVENPKKISNPDLCGALLIPKKFFNDFKGFNLLLSDNPRLDFAKLTNIFSKNLVLTESVSIENFDKLNISFGAESKIGKNFICGRNVIIGNNVHIGNNVLIGDNAIINSNVILGNNVKIGQGTVVGSEGFGNVRIDDGSWKHIGHLGGVSISDNVSIGSNCTIDRGTIDNTEIHEGVVIDNLVHIAHNVVIGKNTAIAAKVGIAGSCIIGKRNMIGGMVGIVDHIKTADDVIISATSTVNNDLNESGIYTGIMPISKHASWKRIALWITKLDKIAKFLNLKKI